MSWNPLYSQGIRVKTVAVLFTLAISALSLPAFADNSDAHHNNTADDYVSEIFGTTVPDKQTAAERSVEPYLKPPLPLKIINNGPPPVPHDIPVVAATPDMPSSLLNSRELLWPMRGGIVSSRFGMRWGKFHHGTDIAAPMGTPIFAAAEGKVVFSGWQEGYGNLVVVDHGNGVKTKYGHCSKLLVRVGETVRQGDILGKVGATGHATGPHLHYEVVREGLARNPEFFTRRR